VVGSAVVPTWITLVLRNPEPLTVSVRAPDPAVMVVGLMDEMAGVGVAVEPPPAGSPEPELVLEPPPPHPFSKAATPRAKTKTRKRTEESQNLHRAQTLSKGPYFPRCALNKLAIWIQLININAAVELWQMLFGNSGERNDCYVEVTMIAASNSSTHNRRRD
jgi:hypothetical protein